MRGLTCLIVCTGDPNYKRSRPMRACAQRLHSCMTMRSLTSVTYLPHICHTSAIYLSHICHTCVTWLSRLLYVCHTSVACLSHICRMSATYLLRVSYICCMSVTHLSHMLCQTVIDPVDLSASHMRTEAGPGSEAPAWVRRRPQTKRQATFTVAVAVPVLTPPTSLVQPGVRPTARYVGTRHGRHLPGVL